MDLQVEAKTAFVSGSTQGIGYAIARGLLREGARVIINGRAREKIDRAIDRLRAEIPGAKISGIAADFTDPVKVNGLIAALPDVDILINSAAAWLNSPKIPASR
jgi:NAD(P)-dependent dehydrogenase (short-subunit alcohol dehydrogenase family)